MTYWVIDGQKFTLEEYDELQRQQRLEKQRSQEEAARLSRELGAAYAALKEHLRRNPEAQQITDERAVDQQIYENLKRNLQRADKAPRCTAVKEDGTVCGSPKIKDHVYCYAHFQMLQGRAKKLVLPALEDANAIQMAVMRVQRALIDDEISEKKAGLLLYSIQIAAANAGKTTFGQAKDEDMVTEVREQVEVIEHQGRNLPLMHSDLRAKEQGIPQINADDRGPEGQTLRRMNTDPTNQDEGLGKMLPQSTEVYANRSSSSETHANLG
jgi:hypothetical protein